MKRIHYMAIVALTLASLTIITTPRACARIDYGAPEQPPIPTDAVPPSYSYQNTIHEFYAKGGYQGRSVKVDLSNAGGYILYHGVQISFIGWYSQYWGAYQLFLVHLVNVTETNFYIAYLYLMEYGGYKWIGFWIYSYISMWGTGNPSQHEWVGWFLGDFWIGEETLAPSVDVPEMEIRADSKCINHLYSDGPYLIINAFQGYTEMTLFDVDVEMTLYPLLNYLFVYDPTVGYWHELWTLGVDNSGNYYYIIFYMYENYPDWVLPGYMLRLNDYRLQLGYSWYYSPWWYQLEVGP